MLSTVVPHGSAIAGVANTYNTPTVETQLFFGEKWQTVLELHNRDTTLPIDEILLEVCNALACVYARAVSCHLIFLNSGI
jgi:hypothetical protein